MPTKKQTKQPQDKKPKCLKCWDKGFASQLVRVHTSADFSEDKESDEVKEVKNYCSCKKGKRMKRESLKIKQPQKCSYQCRELPECDLCKEWGHNHKQLPKWKMEFVINRKNWQNINGYVAWGLIEKFILNYKKQWEAKEKELVIGKIKKELPKIVLYHFGYKTRGDKGEKIGAIYVLADILQKLKSNK